MEPEVRARFERIETLLDSLAKRHAESEARFEKRMEALTERQAESEARFDRMEARFEKRMEALAGRQAESEARFEKRSNATLKIVQTGMRMLVRIEDRLVRLEDKMGDLADSQKRTDRTLQAFINSLTKGGDGR